mmetsp:Transcript_11309/g.31497  ORF Transcript_11309/g.31497 Transcript_11309/m.31497 type:complete len:338 (+) Transcript_11309:16-1029(+)
MSIYIVVNYNLLLPTTFVQHQTPKLPPNKLPPSSINQSIDVSCQAALEERGKGLETTLVLRVGFASHGKHPSSLRRVRDQLDQEHGRVVLELGILVKFVHGLLAPRGHGENANRFHLIAELGHLCPDVWRGNRKGLLRAKGAPKLLELSGIHEGRGVQPDALLHSSSSSTRRLLHVQHVQQRHGVRLKSSRLGRWGTVRSSSRRCRRCRYCCVGQVIRQVEQVRVGVRRPALVLPARGVALHRLEVVEVVLVLDLIVVRDKVRRRLAVKRRQAVEFLEERLLELGAKLLRKGRRRRRVGAQHLSRDLDVLLEQPEVEQGPVVHVLVGALRALLEHVR